MSIDRMKCEEAVLRLRQKGIVATANRILVYRKLKDEQRPMSLSMLEALMPDMDKSSIFRTLALFLEHDVVHSFEDGRGILNYELCHSKGACSHKDSHIHFYCEKCKKSFCLDDVQMPQFNLPEGFVLHSTSFVIKGECPECSRKRNG